MLPEPKPVNAEAAERHAISIEAVVEEGEAVVEEGEAREAAVEAANEPIAENGEDGVKWRPHRRTTRNKPTAPEPRYLSTLQAAEYLGVSRQTLEIGRHKGTGPIYCRPVNSRIVRYFLPDLDAWMQDSRRQHTAAAIGPTEEGCCHE